MTYSYSTAFSASPEPGPRPLKTEAEIEDGKEAYTNNNIVNEENEGEGEDASEDYMDEQQTCLHKS